MSEPNSSEADRIHFSVNGDSSELLDLCGTFKPPQSLQASSHLSDFSDYKRLHKASIDDPEKFWSAFAKEYHFHSPVTGKFLDYNFDVRKGPIFIKWFEGAKTNLCYNALDRNVLKGLANKIAYYWEGNDPNDCGKYTYGELLHEVCKFANVLKSKGVKKGDRVAIYLPMIVELPVSVLACARIGAVHSVVFGGFSAESLAARIVDAGAKILITADGVWRGTKLIHLKEIADEALHLCSSQGFTGVQCIVVRHLTPSPDQIMAKDALNQHGKRPYAHLNAAFISGRDYWYHELTATASAVCEVEWLDAEDPLFMLYTSGSTGKPKGVVHTQAGYLLYAATTFKYVFDYQPNDIFWCTADVGWITGHTYVVYGPLANGATSVLFEGVPFHPDADRFWAVCEKLRVTKFYTAPTAIRALMKFGEDFVKRHDLSSLKILGTVGEPINPEAWMWYHNVVGECRCAIVDTYWQTETGGHVITPLPGCIATRPGSATFPFFGVEPAILSEEGKEIVGPGEGYLVFKRPWPGIMRTVYGDHKRFEHTYFAKFPGYYCTMDGCKRDDDGYYWITGRVDDMMNVSGHLLSTAEIESAMVEHKSVAEAAVVSRFHDVKGESPYVFVTLKNNIELTPQLIEELKKKVRMKIGPHAVPDIIQLAPGLPKTRSGKIMRRILRKVATGDKNNLGDTTTLADEAVVDELYRHRPEGAGLVKIIE